MFKLSSSRRECFLHEARAAGRKEPGGQGAGRMDTGGGGQGATGGAAGQPARYQGQARW